MLHVNRREPHAAPLGILDQRGRRVKPHRLVVEHRRVERGWIVRLQIRARIDEQRKACRMRLGKPIQRKRGDRADDFLRYLFSNPLAGDTRA
jgi:hypothetical protein